ncbi:MAG: hypothetical protein R6U85_10730 [Salinivirgaceae bacterium]
MATCTSGIAANLINDCNNLPTAGLERVIYAFNRSEISGTKDATNPNLMTGLSVESGAQGFKIEGYKKTNNVGFDFEADETMPERYPQFFSSVIWGIDAETVKALNDLNDIVIVVENKNAGQAGDGKFEVYGFDTGLYKTNLTRRSNENGGTFTLEMGSLEGEAPTRSHYVLFDTDAATTKALLEDLLVEQS